MNQAIQRPLISQPGNPGSSQILAAWQNSALQGQVPAYRESFPGDKMAIYQQNQGVVDPGIQSTTPLEQYSGASAAVPSTTPEAPAGQPVEQQQPQGPAGQALWKPLSESDGNLVMLFPYVAGTVVIKDANTGEVLDTGRSTGPSNGYADTVRFSRPGSAYREVIVEDSLGNAIYIKDGSARIENIEVYGGANQPGAFPNLGASVTPTIPAFQPIEETPKPKRPKGPKLKLPASTFKAAPAPTTEREDAPSRSVKEFSQAFQKQRGR